MSTKTSLFAGFIIGNIIKNLNQIVENDEPICPERYNLKNSDNCNVGCTICWSNALEKYEECN